MRLSLLLVFAFVPLRPTPAGLDKSVGLITTVYYKDPADPQWKNDPAMKEYLAWIKQYYPEGNPIDIFNLVGYLQAQLLVQVLKQSGDNLTRENVMKQAANIKDAQLPLMLPGIKLNTSPDDYFLIEQAQLGRFDGKEWKLLGKVLGR